MLFDVHAPPVQEDAPTEQPHELQDPDRLAALQEKLRYEQEEADLQRERLAAEQVIMRKTLAVQTYSQLEPDLDTFWIMTCALCSILNSKAGAPQVFQRTYDGSMRQSA
jgi:hypothetical protein